ncbi:unnamed protein product [Paramecium sonneborni]|uniref:Transmembrane protein n=1 Tax=Paramecium sonneborni TaxID=65129 RepID=A0A8S1PYE9_9CILI|nr:unnamed protein product [Paramecium sonneborni]
MRFQFQFIIGISLLFQLIVSNSRKCEIVEIESNQKFISKQINVLLIESDQDELQDFNNNNYNIVEESLKISNYVDDNLISTQIIEHLGFDQLLCKFIKSQIYVISCIKISNFYKRQSLNFKDQIILTLELSNLDGSMCNEFFFNQQSQFQIFCLNNSYINIYSVDLEHIIKLELQYKIDQRQYELCKIKYFKLEDNHYLISFFQCKNWGVYSYINQDFKIFLNYELVLNENAIQISYLENIKICQTTLFLIVENGNYHFLINKQNQAKFQIFISISQNLKKILLSWNCLYLYEVEYNSLINKTKIFNRGYSFQYSLNGQPIYVQTLQNILFVKTQNELQIIYNQKIKQSIKTNSSYFVFNDKYNLIFQLDQISNYIVFYKFSYPRNLIQPTQKYIFYIQTSPFFNQKIKHCSEFKYITQTNSNNITLKIINSCQKTSQLLLNKQDLNLPYQYLIKLEQKYEFRINIQDQYSFFQICPIKSIYKQDSILEYYQTKINNKSFSFVKTKEYIYIQNCDDMPQFKISTKECAVFFYQSQVLLWYQNKNLLKLINFQYEKKLEIKFDSRITNIIQFQMIVIVFTSNNKDPQLIDMITQIKITLKSKVYKILNKLNEIYLQDKKKYENEIIQFFYFSQATPQFIQYLQYFIFEIHTKIIYTRLDNIQIVFIKEMMSKQFYILGIHQTNNQIIDHYFDFVQIEILYKVNLDDYNLIKPLQYQIATKHIAIACQKENKIFALIFEIRIIKPLKLLKIIQISKNNFFFSEENFFYYDSFGEIIIINILNFDIQLENPVPQQSDHVTNTEISFQIISTIQTEPVVNLRFQLKFYNECFGLFQKSDHFQLNQSTNNQPKILISNYFFGPIDQIKIVDNDKTQIYGPLLLSDDKNDLKEIMIENINFPQKFHYLQTQPKKLIFYYNSQYSLIFNQYKEVFFNVIFLDEERILFLFFSEVENELIGMIYQIKKDSLNLIIEPIFVTNITLNSNYDQYQVIKTGNLIVFKSEIPLIIYQNFNSSIKLIENHLNILDIFKIQGYNNLYISISRVNSEGDFLFNILYSNQFELIVNKTAILYWDQILIELTKFIDIDNYRSLNYQNKSNILECNIEEQIAKIVIIQTFRQYSVLSDILFYLNNYSIQYIPQKFLRNDIDEEIVTLELYNQNILFLKSFSNSIYFYDLNQDSKIYDYIGRQDQNNYSYYQLNTTHFFIFQRNTDKDLIFIGEIGYKIDVKNKTLGDKTFTLVAENKVSQAQCNITMINNDDQKENYIVFKQIMIIFGGIIVFYFIIRRMQLKRKQLNNLKQSRAYFSDSQEESQNNE